MEPKKLFQSIGVLVTTVIAILLFISEYDKIINFFFPKERHISLALFIVSLSASVLVTFYIMYSLYYREKRKYNQTKIERDNLNIVLTDTQKLSYIDDVTGLSNEKKFKKDIMERDKCLFQLILLDLDGFGSINKKYGYDRGDEVIRAIAQDVYSGMRRDEKIYKKDVIEETSLIKRVYRKYTGGDELIFLIKGRQYDAVGFIARLQDQLNHLSNDSDVIKGIYKIKFHAVIVPLEPDESYDDAKTNMHKMFKYAIEEKDNLRVYWDKDIENEDRKKDGFAYDKARKLFKIE